MTNEIYGNTNNKKITLMLILGLIGIIYTFITQQIIIGLGIVILPFGFIILHLLLKKPYNIFIGIFILNYFFIAIMRYTNIVGLSFVIDVMLFLAIISALVYGTIFHTIDWKRCKNTSVFLALIWTIYTILEVMNPNGIFAAWFRSRFFIYYPIITAIIASILVTNQKQVKNIFILYAIFTLISILKQLIQEYIGFDPIEWAWLESGAKSTHILPGITRYFSIFSDAGNFGANMGATTLIFGIAAYYFKGKGWKFFFIIISFLSLYSMFSSGTRGAIAVPLAGLALFTILSKNVTTFTITSIMGIVIYIFFAYTNIGQSYTTIRRMRTAFRPETDASYLVRIENQNKLAVYMANKPFGAGLGLSGGEAARFLSKGHILTTPNDSTYVKIWIETGVIGLWLFLAYLVGSILRGSYIAMFKMKNKELRGILVAILCGEFGLCVAAYGNAFLTQFPTGIMLYSTLAICVLGKEIEETPVKNEIIK